MNKIKEVYEQIGNEYQQQKRLVWPEMKAFLSELKAGQKVLDVGCGEGRILQDIKVRIDYTGIDFSDKLISIARERYGKRRECKFLLGDILEEKSWRKIGKEKNSKRFEAIFCVAVIHHLLTKKEQLMVMKKMKENLAKGGRMYLSVWRLGKRKFWGEHLKSWKLKFKRLPESLRWVEIPFRQGEQKRLYTLIGKRRLKTLARLAGWKKIEIVKSKNNWWILGS